MQKSKLIQILKTFSRQEMKDFEKFISSPYFSSGRNLKPLFSVLKKYFPLFDSPYFTSERIFRKLYPAKKYEKKKSGHILHVMISEMMTLAEKFMVYNGFECGRFSYYYNTCLAEIYRDKNLFESVIKILLQNSKAVDDDMKKEKSFYRRIETNALLRDIFVKVTNPKQEYIHTSNSILYICAHIFDIFAEFHNKFRANKHNFNLIYKGDDIILNFVKTFDINLFDKECVEDAYETKNLVLINYYYLDSFIDESNDKSIFNAIDIYMKIFDKLDRYRQIQMYTLLLNRCIGKSRFEPSYKKKGNELIDFVWGKGVFGNDSKKYILPFNYISVLHFKISSSGKKNNSKFVSEYSNKVAPEFREDIKNYSYAYICYKEKSFRKCLDLISKNDSLNLSPMKANYYRLKIRSLYELSYFEEALSVIDSFWHFLRKNVNVSDIIRDDNIKFINETKKSIKAKLGENVIEDNGL